MTDEHIDLNYILANKKIDLPEVIEIREKIKASFSDIYFKEDTHQYFLPKEGNIEVNCVSNVTHKYIPYANWDEICKRSAAKIGVTPAELKARWSYNSMRSLNSGTHVHEYGESWFYYANGDTDSVLPGFKRQIEKGYFLPNSKKEEAVESFWNWLFKMDCLYPVLAETQVYTKKYAGTFDLLLYYKHPTDNSKSGLIIADYKTNASLNKDYARSHNQMLLAPFESFYNEDESLYTLQLSLYQIPLEDIGLNVVGRRLVWLKEDGTYELRALKNVTNELRVDLNL